MATDEKSHSQAKDIRPMRRREHLMDLGTVRSMGFAICDVRHRSSTVGESIAGERTGRRHGEGGTNDVGVI